MKIYADEMEDDRFAYARRIEKMAMAIFGQALVPNSLIIAQTFWAIRNQRQESAERSVFNLPTEYSDGWGYHISPELFLAVAALCDGEQNLLRALSHDDVCIESIVRCVEEHRMLEDDAIFELGGTFLDQIVSSSGKRRSYDAKFGKQNCLTVADGSTADSNLQVIMASALFEETSGIIRTLADGPASRKELQPVFQSLGYGEKYYDEYRRAQSRIAAFELFAWARNHLATGGYLVVNNVLSPAAVPDEEQLAFLGFASHPTMYPKQMSGPGGDYWAAIHVFQAGLKRDASERLTAVIEDYPPGTGRWQKRLRQRQWSWLDGKIAAKWL